MRGNVIDCVCVCVCVCVFRSRYMETSRICGFASEEVYVWV